MTGIVQIIGGVTTLTGVAITNYSVKAGVENTSKIRNAYKESVALFEKDDDETDETEEKDNG